MLLGNVKCLVKYEQAGMYDNSEGSRVCKIQIVGTLDKN